MNDINSMKVVKVKKLLLKKNYEEVIVLIENNFSDIEKTSEILNILGVSKLQKKNSSNFDLLSAIENFRDCYLMEKNTNQGIEGLLNFIISSNKANRYDDSVKYFKETELTMGYIPKLFHLMVNVYEKLNEIENAIYYLKKIMENEGIENNTLQKYIYFNSYINKWSQKDFFENTIKLEDILPQYRVDELINISKNKKIKLAFLSSDLRGNHAVVGFLKTIVENVNKDKFEIILFSNRKINKEDETSSDLKNFSPFLLKISLIVIKFFFSIFLSISINSNFCFFATLLPKVVFPTAIIPNKTRFFFTIA